MIEFHSMTNFVWNWVKLLDVCLWWSKWMLNKNVCCWCFSDDLIWWFDLMIFWFSNTNVSSEVIKKKNLLFCESRLSRRFVCSERSLRQSKRVYYASFLSIHNESIMLRCSRWMIKIKLSLLCFYSFTEFNCKKFCLFECSRIMNEHEERKLRYNVRCYAEI